MKTHSQIAEEACEAVRQHFQTVLDEAASEGFVITVALEPVHPLAMGRYKMVADVRPGAKMRAAIAKAEAA